MESEVSDVMNSGEEETETEETDRTNGVTDAERRARAEGRKKHSRPIATVEVNGHTVQAEKVWGSALFPTGMVRDYHQWCRDTNRKASDVVSGIIRLGMEPVFREVEETKEKRDQVRAVKKLGRDEEEMLKAEQKLQAQQAAVTAKLAALQSRIQEIKTNKDEGGVVPLSAILEQMQTPVLKIEPAASKDGRGRVKAAKAGK